jgi:hypothetical protein
VDTIFFQYTFGSEEYCEYVGTPFNDVFGFFLKGPGINGDLPDGYVNIARVPGADAPVTINNVNHDLNATYYRNNNDSPPCDQAGSFDMAGLEHDGFTTVLTAAAVVIPGETYHCLIGLSDVADGIFDSGVFIGIQSLCGDGNLKPRPSFDLAVTTGNEITFANSTLYATAWNWDFGDGTSTTERYPTAAFRLYPTVADDRLTVEWKLPAPATAQLLDLNGKAVWQGNVQGKESIPTSRLAPGVYTFAVQTAGQRWVKKVVKR